MKSFGYTPSPRQLQILKGMEAEADQPFPFRVYELQRNGTREMVAIFLAHLTITTYAFRNLLPQQYNENFHFLSNFGDIIPREQEIQSPVNFVARGNEGGSPYAVDIVRLGKDETIFHSLQIVRHYGGDKCSSVLTTVPLLLSKLKLSEVKAAIEGQVERKMNCNFADKITNRNCVLEPKTNPNSKGRRRNSAT
jgi:hypothetical protein